MKMLVTGGAGFIGSNFVRMMLDNHDVEALICLDKLTYAGNLNNLESCRGDSRFKFYQGCITNASLVEELLGTWGIDLVINFAAETHVDRSITGAPVFIETNIVGTQVLLETCMKSWMNGKNSEGYPEYRNGVRFIQVSTDEVYGSIEEGGSFTEGSNIVPNSPYAASKASADLLVRAYWKTYRLPVNITRCSNNYGPHQYPEKLIPLMIHAALTDGSLPVYGDGMQVRDWIHVDDHCCAIWKVIEKGVLGEVYNIGANCEKENISIVKLVLKQLGKGEELISYVQDRLGHDKRYSVDSAKIRNLGWKPEREFSNALAETIEWYRVNDCHWQKNK